MVGCRFDAHRHSQFERTNQPTALDTACVHRGRSDFDDGLRLAGEAVSMMRWLLLLILLPGSAWAETWTGMAHVVDGDTIYVDQTRLRLLGTDSFESAQTCMRNDQQYACGTEATRALIGIIQNRPVRCEGSQRDRYKRPLVRCWVGDLDLGREMVRLGWAVSEYGTEYRADQDHAQAVRAGAWAGTFTRPQEWRRVSPRQGQ